jgi:hypothetical protein
MDNFKVTTDTYLEVGIQYSVLAPLKGSTKYALQDCLVVRSHTNDDRSTTYIMKPVSTKKGL